MIENKTFLDTNILVYSHDISAGHKHSIACGIIRDLWENRLGVISTQVLQEFFITVTKKISSPLDKKIAKEIVRDLMEWDVVINDKESILDSIDIHSKYKYSFWDSMIIQAAARGGAKILFSEDMSDSRIVNGVKIINPFVGA
ncbi:MAG: PIN domain-containing protein [bacterium]